MRGVVLLSDPFVLLVSDLVAHWNPIILSVTPRASILYVLILPVLLKPLPDLVEERMPLF